MADMKQFLFWSMILDALDWFRAMGDEKLVLFRYPSNNMLQKASISLPASLSGAASCLLFEALIKYSILL
jgi:hypothetical protein